LPDFNSEFFVSVVGTRRLTDYGRKNTFAVAADLAVAGAIVVSGMAIGIDGVAHAGALSAEKPTVAVIGSGIDVCYPPQHKRLAREIVKDGCVMTEYEPGRRPDKRNFPIRNRIISALSSATLLMEGSERSGALITARHAKEQGRAVYAFPGNVGNSSSVASNLLIKNGAKLFTSADDIVRDFEFKSGGKLNPFMLATASNRDIAVVLRELEVACVTPSDKIFKAPRAKKKEVSASAEYTTQPKEAEANDAESKVASSFDKTTLALYKKIPLDCECTVDELVDEEHSLRSVMGGLLKLEVAKFVTMLPGDRVKRNFK
jgi:DNA protecting protein DprA